MNWVVQFVTAFDVMLTFYIWLDEFEDEETDLIFKPVVYETESSQLKV
jgi:hypothetical protein